jgi:hypothetical protein
MSIRGTVSLAFAVVWLAAVHGCDEQFPAAPAARNNEVERKQETEGCRVSGHIVSTAWRDLGGGIERAIVTASTLPDLEQAEDVYAEGEQFEVRLPPGRYRLMCSANGTRGATFIAQNREITVPKDQDNLDIGDIDLPISKTTALYGQPAPELTGIIA